ncbi:MAG: molybdopterin oxidoreductase family protein [Pseudomonadota bacterium]
MGAGRKSLLRQEQADTSPVVADEVKHTTCYMCACRCGIRVHLKDGKVRYIEGNPDHPVNQGVLCAKGSAGIMQHYSPARLRKPLLRTGERGKGEFKEIEWDEALGLATGWLGNIRKTDPKRLAFFTGRDQSQALTGWWASQFGTPNYAAHGGFCSVNMAAAGLYSIGGAFWEFGEPDWELTRYFLMFGVAEDHDSNPLKAGIGKMKTLGKAKFVSVNPVRGGYSAVADEWIGIRPGTDGLFVFALIHELLKADKVDWEFLARYTNGGWLVIQDPGAADDGLFARDKDGNPLCLDGKTKKLASALSPDATPAMVGKHKLADGRTAVPSFELMARRYMDDRYAPDNVTEAIGIPADTIRRIAAELADAAFEQTIELDIEWMDWAGRTHDKMIGRPVSMHAMRGISAHSNGFHTCRAIHVLQMLLGSVDTPGGFRYKPPFPKPIPPLPQPTAGTGKPNTPLGGPPLGFPLGPEDLLLDEDGKPKRIDKGFSWEHPLSVHGLMHMVIHNAWAGDPYPIDTLFLYMANMSWNSTMNVPGTIHALTDRDEETGEYKIPHIIYSDAYSSEMVAYADLVLPDTTYLERWDCISLLDRPICTAEGPADAIRQPVVKPDRDVRAFQEVLLDLGARLRLPGMVNKNGSPKYPGGYSDYIVNHERGPGIGPLAGWRGEDGHAQGRGAPNEDQLDRYIENGCFWNDPMPDDAHYYKHANMGYLNYAQDMGWIPNNRQIVLQLYSEVLQKFRLAARGHGEIQPPESERERIETFFDPLPLWHRPFEEDAVSEAEFPMHALTQRPMQMYHSWGSQNAWLRQITARNRLYMAREMGAKLEVGDEDWVWVVSHHGRVKAQVKLMDGVNPDTVWTWNAIGKRKGAWALDGDAPETRKGFLLNHIISELLPPRKDGYRYSNSDPITGQAAWFDLRVRIEKCAAHEAGETEPMFETLSSPPGVGQGRPATLRYGKELKPEPSGHTGGFHREFIGNRREIAETVPGVAGGRGNKARAKPKSEGES